LVVSRANSQSQNILDLKGQDRPSSQKERGLSFAEALKNKSKDSIASKSETKSKQQNKKENENDYAGVDSQSTAQNSNPHNGKKITANSQRSGEIGSKYSGPIPQEKNAEQNLNTKLQPITSFAPPALESIQESQDIKGLSEVVNADSKELTQLSDLVSLDNEGETLLTMSENLNLERPNEEGFNSPLSTTSSEVENKTLVDQGLENKSALSDIMKEMERLENSEVLENFKNNQKVVDTSIKSPFVSLSLKESLVNQEKLQVSPLDLSTTTEGSTAQSLIPSISGSSNGLSFGQEASQFNHDLSKDNSELTGQFVPVEQQTPADFTKPLTAATTGGLIDNAADSKIENMSAIISEARAIVDDGGGSMEIHLQPEGLGKVQLKVAVHEGRVHVEMMTDNPAAKKALEDGLFEVRNALEGQKLLVETLKVEMGQNVQKDFTDMRDHMQEQQNRDFAQDFLEQFRQDRENRFGGLIDRFRNSPVPMGENELKLNGRNPYAGSGKGQTLNLVA